MSYTQTKAYVESKVMDYFENNNLDWQLKFPLVVLKPKAKSRCQVRMQEGASVNTNIGSRYFERVSGEVWLELTVPVDNNEGTKELDEIVDGLKFAFQNTQVRLEDQSVIKFGMVFFDNEGDIGERFHYHIIVPYIRNEPPREVQDITSF